MYQLVSPAYQLEAVGVHKLVGDLCPKQPACAAGTHCPGVHFLRVGPYQMYMAVKEQRCKLVVAKLPVASRLMTGPVNFKSWETSFLEKFKTFSPQFYQFIFKKNRFDHPL